MKHEKKGADTMNKFKYGFRYDPMKWVSENKSLQGALVRSRGLQTPKAGDTELVQAEIEKILAAQLPDGLLSDDKKHAMQFTAERLIRLSRNAHPWNYCILPACVLYVGIQNYYGAYRIHLNIQQE